jgi:dTDP-L-rhamnose 4-epimerase
MHQKTILITGGAGFIGAQLSSDLIEAGYHVRVLDNLTPQVHGSDRQKPAYLHPEVDLIVGDLRDEGKITKAIQGVDVVYHLAAAVGVGQSMYEIEHYTSVNSLGTAVLLQAIARKPVSKLIVASSMSIYGEGLYRSVDSELPLHFQRSLSDLEMGKWEILDEAGTALLPVPTPETKTPDLSSIYALTKYDQERMSLLFGRAYGIPTVALRFFNVYGRHQSLSNPYTGVLAIFAARLLSDLRPRIFEDGLQRRDFVHVKDISRACRLALESSAANFEAINVGGGKSYTILEVARLLARKLGREHLIPEITQLFRVGDIRHCFSDGSKAERLLGYRAEIDFESGLEDYVHWLREQKSIRIQDDPNQELLNRGLAF